MSKRRKSKGKRINPTYWVFCEGETEKEYISFLRTKYRLPFEIISKVSGSNINNQFIKKSKQEKPVHPKDKNFLVYDGDIPEIVEQLKKVDDASKVLSTPSIELWFLYHYKDQKALISTADCVKELSSRNKKSYKKGFIDKKLRLKLSDHWRKACERAKKSKFPQNPSSNMHILIEELERVKSR